MEMMVMMVPEMQEARCCGCNSGSDIKKNLVQMQGCGWVWWWGGDVIVVVIYDIKKLIKSSIICEGYTYII